MRYDKPIHREICDLYAAGWRCKQIAYHFGVSPSHVSHVARSRGLFRYKIRPLQEQLTIYLPPEVVAWFRKRHGKGFTIKMRKVLTDHTFHQETLSCPLKSTNSSPE